MPIKPTLSPEDAAALADRLGPHALAKRLAREEKIWNRKTLRSKELGKFSFESCLTLLLKSCGLWARARREFLDVRVEENHVTLDALPAPFEGFRILQLSDLHCDLDPFLMDIVEEKISELNYDLAVLTGDYQDCRVMDQELSTRLMTRLIRRLSGPKFGILGNHDFAASIAVFERAGLPILLNENATITREGQRIWICGIDDPRFFGTHDLAAARRDVRANDIAILLAHAPDVWREAEAADYSLLLAGHTHGGQLCLPGGFPLVRNSAAPRALTSGAWRSGKLQGYTSRGTGACSVPARLFCPPEVTLHIFHSEPTQSARDR